MHSWQKKSLLDSRDKLLSINANIGIYWPTRVRCFFYQNAKVQKAPKHDFWTDWSVFGAFVKKTHVATRTVNFCQLVPILSHVGAMRYTRIKNFKKHQTHDFWTDWSVLGAFVAKDHFATRAANFCELIPILPHVGAKLYSGIKKFKKHENMIFGHIGVCWVHSWQKLTSLLARRTFVN